MYRPHRRRRRHHRHRRRRRRRHRRRRLAHHRRLRAPRNLDPGALGQRPKVAAMRAFSRSRRSPSAPLIFT